jgi:AraC-like DNA-binding protein
MSLNFCSIEWVSNPTCATRGIRCGSGLAGLSLLMQGRRVSEVAAEVGYNSLSAFGKAFAKLTGESPRQLRSRARVSD